MSQLPSARSTRDSDRKIKVRHHALISNMVAEPVRQLQYIDERCKLSRLSRSIVSRKLTQEVMELSAAIEQLSTAATEYTAQRVNGTVRQGAHHHGRECHQAADRTAERSINEQAVTDVKAEMSSVVEHVTKAKSLKREKRRTAEIAWLSGSVFVLFLQTVHRVTVWLYTSEEIVKVIHPQHFTGTYSGTNRGADHQSSEDCAADDASAAIR